MRTESKKTLLGREVIIVSLLALTLSSCILSSSGGGSSSRGATANTTYSVDPNYGRYLEDNPIILADNEDLSYSANMANYLSDEKYITSNQFLIGSCSAGGSDVTKCFEVRVDDSSGYLSATENRWAFSPSDDTEEFLQVQAFGNMRDITEKFHDSVEWSYELSQGYGYNSAIPYELYSSDERAFWYPSGVLKAYSECEEFNNAYYDASTKEICLGIIGNDLRTYSYMALDPTITFHEIGHAYTHILMNARHRANNTDTDIDSNLGYVFYDEAGSIGEGLSDFYSFYMTERTHFAEWGLGRFLSVPQSRPMSEDDDIHAAGINLSGEGRLSYPEYINYDPNEADVPYEAVHYGGQIASHFLHAFYISLLAESEVDDDYGIYYLDEDEDGEYEEYSYVENLYHCGMTKENALNMTMHLVFETLMELGDQTATGFGDVDDTIYNVNLDPDNAIEWLSMVKPINYRTFFQTFAKYFILTVGNDSYGMCNGLAYDKDEFELLMDRYGLLLFKTYNEDGNSHEDGHDGDHTAVTSTNRIQTVLVSKSKLKLDSRDDSATAFVIDTQSDILAAVESLILSGQMESISEQIDDSFAYNNGNAQISPGEVVGVALNVYNNSNSTMAGVQILANDWDHFSNSNPCNNLGDDFPLDTEGAADSSEEADYSENFESGSGDLVAGDCNYVTKDNGLEDDEELYPVCFVEYADDDATKWVNQNKYRQEIGLSANNCLGGSDSLNDCFIRVIKGGDQAYFSRLDAKSTWTETLDNDTTGTPTFTTSNVIFMEVSPWIPPGTTFNCRMRARFTNCSDCWHDSNFDNDDYLDFEFSGAEPFQILNFQFTVID